MTTSKRASAATPVTAPTGALVRVSTNTAGMQGNRDSNDAVISQDGRWVAFASRAGNLVVGDSNGTWDIFLRDLLTGTVTRVSMGTRQANAGGNGPQGSYHPVFSRNARYLAFESYASNLVPGDSNQSEDVFIKDLVTGVIRRVSTSTTGVQGNSLSFAPSLSASGRQVAFISSATNLVNGDTNGVWDIFVKNLDTGVLVRASTSAGGAQANDASRDPVLFADGSKVVFTSAASNLVDGDTNGFSDIFVKDLRTGAISRVSTPAAGGQANGDSGAAALSADGHLLVFESRASNLVPGDTNGFSDIFLKNLITGAITRISTSASGAQAQANPRGPSGSYQPTLSADGRKVAFSSYAANLVAGDTNGMLDVFLKDLQTGAITRVSTGTAGQQGDFNSAGPSLSADGARVVFYSGASNLVNGDSNGSTDVFVKQVVRPPVKMKSGSPQAMAMTAQVDRLVGAMAGFGAPGAVAGHVPVQGDGTRAVLGAGQD